MFKLLYPRLYVDSILDIPIERMGEMNITAFIFDLDNTVTEWNSQKICEEIIQWFSLIKQQGFKACILSNNCEQRVLAVAKSLDIPYVHRAQKPRRGGYQRALSLMNVAALNTAVIGDQIFTDVLGGNRAGLFTILVKPIARKEFFGTKISRSMECLVLSQLKRKIKRGEIS
ncbi:MAG: YqeG family HAD IIIA-type phosphatase [Syntrophomonadaceae bacterium]|jgi:HAD superfamily phosphatase (TIGR01668 family)